MQLNFNELKNQIKDWGLELGFYKVGITDTNLSIAESRLNQWLENKFNANMDYMQKHGTKRSRPEELVPGTIRIISVSMNYLPPDVALKEVLKDKSKAYIARYTLGKDYHKLIRKKLQKLAEKIQAEIGEFGYRAFCDSAPVLERAIAEKAGIGWTGKNAMIMNKEAGSWFLLGEIYTDLPLPLDEPIKAHCGKCTACIDICPTQAIVAPHIIDARRCISYLTIENKGSIPIEFRKAMGNRIFGCDDCQIICPWNRFAKYTKETSFLPRHNLDNIKLVELFMWSEETFLEKTQGSALRRPGYVGWLRNIAVALGNSPTSDEVISALKSRLNFPSDIVQEHVKWSLDKHK